MFDFDDSCEECFVSDITLAQHKMFFFDNFTQFEEIVFFGLLGQSVILIYFSIFVIVDPDLIFFSGIENCQSFFGLDIVCCSLSKNISSCLDTIDEFDQVSIYFVCEDSLYFIFSKECSGTD